MEGVRWLSAVVLLVTTLPDVAVSAPPDALARARALVAQADRQFDEGRFDEAADSYLNALLLAYHPNLLWNIARSHEENRNPDLAAVWFQRIVDAPRATPKRRDLARLRVAALRTQSAPGEAEPIPTPSPSKVPVWRGRAPIAVTEPESGLAPWAWGVMTAGTVASGAGLGLVIYSATDEDPDGLTLEIIAGSLLLAGGITAIPHAATAGRRPARDAQAVDPTAGRTSVRIWPGVGVTADVRLFGLVGAF